MQDQIIDLALELTKVTKAKIADLDQIMLRTQILSMNARLEAARAGEAGKSFTIVAQEMGSVSQEVTALSASLNAAITENAARIQNAGNDMSITFRGSRYADLARNAVEIMDRNLYERSCDVRWWATDSAVVDAVQSPGADAAAHATSRLATILRSYTVYLDLWIADRSGRVIANGRPERYRDVVGADVSREDWFRRGLQTADGDSFVVCDVETAPRLGGAQVATYATAIRAGGATRGEAAGVLGIFFDWEPQARAIVDGISLSREERACSKVMLLDSRFRVIASNEPQAFGQPYALDPRDEWGHTVRNDKIVAYGLTPGYETYRGLGWFGCIESPAHLAS
ncbi:methyl-accepting chemotaxis protein [Novosphingobium mangrovi (ex Huang et al. 2023)]|uniref:Methyl-accepting chemotaxis protein n=1 Tax=Novosphingobium mangrovi (ex Huang et al. 2023) TaxID=2976432 RepID=A0ABT2HZX9_9SPHN|nr:methyl-accepting chemotaxis protein [Novosphingobium mangrovi (ex Huang et al. 2023)]MCT2398103.1 methyl-accepting chemotaxis protein [Novosphingobium mangrovi (ex Huang et al. 2023)]